MYTITVPQQFLRQARKFFKKHSDLKSRFAKVIDDLRKDPFQPNLALHPLSGKLDGCHAVSSHVQLPGNPYAPDHRERNHPA